jgi:hypothetical protein
MVKEAKMTATEHTLPPLNISTPEAARKSAANLWSWRDGVRVYNRVLSTAEIVAIYNQGYELYHTEITDDLNHQLDRVYLDLLAFTSPNAHESAALREAALADIEKLKEMLA